MKHQYFGDINDYCKYGLLRAILAAAPLRLLVAWMLTANDGRSDGRHIDYLQHPGRWEPRDPDLFRFLRAALSDSPVRHVGLIEQTNLLSGAGFFSDLVPAPAPERAAWFEGLLRRAHCADLVFLDPDNGLEVQSCPYGRRNSSKYLYHREVSALWTSGCSLLVYQHYPRVNRSEYIQRRKLEFRESAPGSVFAAFSTARVVFFLLLQPRHHGFLAPVRRLVSSRWGDQFTFPA